MKDSQRLQEKLHSILKSHSELKVINKWPWNDMEFHQIVWVVKDYVDNSGEVINEDPLNTWLEEYYFHLSQSKN